MMGPCSRRNAGRRPRSHAQLVLRELREYLAYSPPPLLEQLIEDAQKIHKQRPILREQLATTIQPTGEA
jgi:hypothetical protein